MLRYTRYLAVAATVAGVGGIVASGALSNEGAMPDPRPTQVATMALTVDPDLVDSFSVLRVRDTPGDSMPADAISATASPERYGRNAQLAKGVDTINGRGWVVPGHEAICLVVPDPVDGYGSSCVSAAYATKFGVIVGMVAPEDPETVRVSMLLPDGANVKVRSGRENGDALAVDDEGMIAAMVPAGSVLEVTSVDGADVQLPMNAGPLSP